VFNCFKDFKAIVEKQSGYKISTVRSDQGGEFTANDFEAFCTQQGIRHQTKPAYTPQLNDVAERKNRTILDMARSLLKAKKLPKQYWAEAVSCAVYLLNRCPTRSLQAVTPQEAWSGHKPSVTHLRVFGCVAYAKIPDARRTKLDDKSEKCIFIGYGDRRMGYKLYNPITKKVIMSRDVIFEEDKSWQWNDDQEAIKWISTDLILEDEVEVPTVLVEGPILPAEPQSPEHKFPVFNRRNTSESSSIPASTSSSSEGPRRMRSLEELYDATQVMEDTTLFCFFANTDPLSFNEAVTEEKWIEAMDEEIHTIEKNDTWKLTYLPENKKAIGVKWVYKTKKNVKGEVQRYKARLVAKGYKQREDIDYGEVFAPIARLETIKLMISLAAQHRWKIYQLNVKSAFLNGFLEEEIYVEQPLGYIKAKNNSKVYKLKKALYGLKQAPRAWNTRIDRYFQENGFEKCPYEHAIYVKKEADGSILFACLYVDDLLFTGNNPIMFEAFKKSMVQEFEMTDIGLMAHFLGLEVVQKEEGIFVSQNSYAKDILERFKMESCNPVSTPVENGVELRKSKVGNVDPTYFKSLVGSVRHLTCTRPNILYGVGLINRYMETPDQSHLNTAKRILRYIKGIINKGMFYTSSTNFNLVGYSDSDWGRDLDERKSTTGFVFFMGDTSFTWSSKK
jgi:hypothetical protein